jgi:thiol-disulfide isomerase/thioredoxin
MKSNKSKWMAAHLLLMAGAAFTPITAATLNVGDPAPKLQVSKWVQGEPVKMFERDKAYIVEFWATWCGPCRVSIPHLNELHTRFKDKGLIVIGQDVWEQDADAVAPFVKKMGQQMTYRVALDSAEGKMAESWMDAAGQTGIPTAFVVDKRGSIAWIGHPMKLKESLLEQVLAGTFDVTKAAAEYKVQHENEERRRALWEEFNRHRQKEEWDQAESALAKMEKLLPEDERDGLAMTRFGLLLDRKDYKKAYQLAARLSDTHPEDATMQNQIAWSIATKDGLAERDLDLAEKIARRANAASKANDDEKAGILDTLARVLFLKGQKESAIEFQQQAVKLTEGSLQRHFQKNLDDYKAGRVPNEARVSSLQQQVRRSIQNKDWDKAESALVDLEKLLSEDERSGLDAQRFRILLGRQDYDGATRLASKLISAPQDNAMTLNQLAWEIAIREGNQERDLDLAEKIARRANEKTKGSNAEILDTLARVLFLKDHKEPAIELQQKAVELAKGRRKAQFQETLDSYKEGKVPKVY